MSNSIELPVPVLDCPHWRVNFRPSVYNPNSIGSLSDCMKIIEKTKLRIGGWEYPLLSNESKQIQYGLNYLSSWVNLAGHIEYWRLYQSGQFIHLFAVRETTVPEFRMEIEENMKHNLGGLSVDDIKKIPGYILFVSITKRISEIFEFCTRLCQAHVYIGDVRISIALKNIKDFVLAAPWDRGWDGYNHASENILPFFGDYRSDHLVANNRDEALTATVYFFERFGWLSPSRKIIMDDINNHLSRKL